jgi:hypothetical protein
MANLRRSITRTAAALTAAPPGQRLALVSGTIASIDVGAAADGSDVVTVTIGADDIEAARVDGWTPSAGDDVKVLLVNGSPLILGRVTGAPDIT